MKNMETTQLSNTNNEMSSSDYLDWDLSNIDTSNLPQNIENPLDLYLECEDDELYTVPLEQTFGPSIIGQNVHLQISFPPKSDRVKVTKDTFNCIDCKQKFGSDKKLKDHMKGAHKIEKPYICICCGKSTKCLKLLNRHVTRCMKLNTIEVNRNKDDDGVNDQSSNTEYVNTTVVNCDIKESGPNTSQIEKPFLCHSCPFKTRSTRLLKSHVDTKHNVNRKQFKCETCQFQCMQKRTFNIHLKSHHMDVEPEVCNICQKQFVSIEKLNRHKLVHSNDRPYKCTQCSSAFKTQGVLTDHIKSVHLKTTARPNIKSVQCTWPGCSKLFRDKHNFKIHYVTHTNEIAFHCDQCKYRTIYKAALVSHKQKIH